MTTGLVDPHARFSAGDTLAERFAIKDPIGQGVTSFVYRAHDGVLGRDVALKVLRATYDEGSIAMRRFEREAELVARLGHPAIVRIWDRGWLATRQPWLALELLEGETMETLITREAPLSFPRIAKMISDVLGALDAAHAIRILHRDFKPANLIVANEQGQERCKLLDFGVGRDLADTKSPRLTGPTQVIGTLGYLAPEQINPALDPDERCDLWAVAVVLYRALAGQAPFGLKGPRVVTSIMNAEVAPPSQHIVGLHPSIDAFFARAFQKDRDRRFQSAAEMRAALLSLL